MTSNLGSEIIRDNYEGMVPGQEDEVADKTKFMLLENLKRSLKPEFLNRIDEVIMFTPLNRDNVLDIVRLQFGFLQKKLLKQGIKVTATEESLKDLAEKGYDPQFGARPVKRLIQKDVLNALSKDLLAGKFGPGDEIVLDDFDGDFVFRKPIKEAEKVEE